MSNPRYSDEWCIEMLRLLIRERCDEGRLSEEEAGELRVYLFKTTPTED